MYYRSRTILRKCSAYLESSPELGLQRADCRVILLGDTCSYKLVELTGPDLFSDRSAQIREFASIASCGRTCGGGRSYYIEAEKVDPMFLRHHPAIRKIGLNLYRGGRWPMSLESPSGSDSVASSRPNAAQPLITPGARIGWESGKLLPDAYFFRLICLVINMGAARKARRRWLRAAWSVSSRSFDLAILHPGRQNSATKSKWNVEISRSARSTSCPSAVPSMTR
jgi:hypothetical protein